MATDTKGRILDAAEQLFADFGFATTSLRDITSEAGVNLASVNYHFGSKEALLTAVLARRIAPINELRLQGLDEVERASDAMGPVLEDVLRAFIAPPFQMQAECGVGDPTFVRLLGRLHVETNEEFRRTFIDDQFMTVISRFTNALQRVLPDVEPTEITARFWFLIGAMAHTMMRAQTGGSTDTSRDPDDTIESLVQFGAGGLSAPVLQPVAERSLSTGTGR